MYKAKKWSGLVKESRFYEYILRQPVLVLFLTFAFLRFGSSFPLSSLLSELLVGDLPSSSTTSAESILVDASVLRVRLGMRGGSLIHRSLAANVLHRPASVILRRSGS